MKRKIYKLLSSAKQGLFALALTVFSGTAYSQNTFTLNYTGNVQTMNLQPGTYTIETWGADGGDNLGNTTTTFLQTGGKGGYSVGTYTLASPTTIYVYVGGRGGNSTSVLNTTVSGGYNGGGYGSANTASGKSSGAGGGGASHVATATGTLGALVSNQPAVLIVAGGGGGGGESNYVSTNTQYNANGGNGGGVAGLQIVSTGYQGRHGKGGTQTAGGGGGDNGAAVAGVPLQGIFGAGGYNNLANGNTTAGGSGAGGGGGGWYGGGAGWVGSTGFNAGSGGGGSGYIGGVTSGTTVALGQTGFLPNPDVTGNGIVIIKEACSVTLAAAGVNANGAICSGATVSLTTNAISNYSWNTGATTSSLVISPTITTSYTLTATSPSNCTSSAVITITVDSAPPTLTVNNTANAGGICPTKTVALTASGATTYTWSGVTSVTNGVAFSPNTAGEYTVNASNACGTRSAVTSVSVHPLPTVIAVASTPSLCSGSSLTLTTTGSNASTYTWTGGFTSGTSFTPAATAIYTVTGTSALTCTALATVPVTVVNTPTAFPTANPPLVCLGNSSTLIATTASNYTWASSSQTVFTNSLVVTPTSSGVTTYTVTKANGVCVDVKTVSVTTNDLPTVLALVTPTVVCSLSPATLAVAGGQTYTWTASTPANFTFTGSSPVVYPAVNTTYTVAAHDGTCINTAVISLSTNPIPNITITPVPASGSICVGQQISLTASGGVNYTWTTVNTTSVSPNITESPTTAIVYNVVANNVHNCTSTSQQVVLVHPNPTITVNVLKPLVCTGGLSTLTAQGANTYTWDANANGALTASTVVTSTNTTSGPVIYTVSGSYATTGCSSSKTVQVSVFMPSLTVTGNTNTCLGGNVTLVASGGTNSYNWNVGNGTPYTFASITTSVGAPAIFTVSAITSSAGVNCPASATVGVDVYFNPTITATTSRTFACKGESVDLSADGGVSYVWSNSVPGGTITVFPTSNTTYTVTGTDANGCSSTGTVAVKYSTCQSINEFTSNHAVNIYPNPSNGQFVIQTDVDLKLTITNELGQAVRFLQLSGANEHKISVSDLAQGIYFVTGSGVNEKIIVTK